MISVTAVGGGREMIAVAASSVTGRDRDAPVDAAEIGFHLLRCLVALGRVLGECAHDDHVEVARNVGALRRRRFGHGREVLHRDLDGRVAAERDDAGEQLVEHDADGVQVRRLVDRRALGLFRGEVLGGPDDRAGFRHLARARARDPEVGHLQASLGIDEHVVRLDVAMDDAVPVREPERGEDLAGVVDRELDRRGPAGDDQLLERATVEVLHRDVVGALGLASVVDRNDVRMREARRVLGLAAEALDELLVAGVALVQDLDRDATAEHLVFGEIDVRHAAHAELALDAVAPVEKRVDQRVGNSHGVTPE